MNIKLTKKQIEFLKNWTEITEPEAATEFFAELMVLEGVSPVDMDLMIDKILEKIKKEGIDKILERIKKKGIK